MDIELQQGTGFAVLQRTRQLHYHVIFTTALDYASIRAIRFSGVDYIQKPIDIQSLQSLIDCRHGEMITSNGKLAVQHLLHTLDHDNLPAHLLVAGLHGREYIALDDILFVESQGEGTVFIMESGSIQVPSVSIKEYEKLLAQSYFFRLHSSFIVNMRKIVLPSVPEMGYVMLSHNRTVPVSPKKSGELALLLSAGDPSPSAR
jgi:two-component system LytT family response regulator